MVIGKLKQCAPWLYFGGTFDPLHNGHLQSAFAAARALNIHNVCFVPCHITPHKDQPSTGGVHRLAMLKRTLSDVRNTGNNINVHVDDYELKHDRPSYTLQTLQYLRQVHGSQTPLFWLMGMDSLASLDLWHGWQALLVYAHIAVVKRPGYVEPSSGGLGIWWQENHATLAEVSGLASGKCLLLETQEKNVSSSVIRMLLQKKKCKKQQIQIAQLVPTAVTDYINQHKLYLTSDTE